MKKRMARKLKRAITFVMCATLVLETINCATMTVSANVSKEEAAANQEQMDAIDTELNESLDGLQNQVDAAAEADQAAYEARLAAEAAAQAAEELASDAADAQNVKNEDGTVVTDEENGNVTVTDAVATAESEVTDANTALNGAQDKINAADTATEKAAKTAEEQKVIAGEERDKAQAAADSAKEALEAIAKAAEDGATQEAMKDELTIIAQAVADAKTASDNAYDAYLATVEDLNTAIKAYNDAVEATKDIDDEGAAQALEAAKAAVTAAEEALAVAEGNYKATMETAQKTYDAVLSNEAISEALNSDSEIIKPAQEAAEAAQKAAEAAKAAEDTVLKVKERQEASDKLAELQSAETAAQDALTAAETEKTAADEKVAELEANKKAVEAEKQAEVTKATEAQQQIDAANEQIAKANEKLKISTDDYVKGDICYSFWCDGDHFWSNGIRYDKDYYTQAEVDKIHADANASLANANAAKATATDALKAANDQIATLNSSINDYESKLADATKAQTQAQNNLTAAQNAKTEASAAVTTQIGVKAELDNEYELLQKFVYSDTEKEVTYISKEENAEIKAMLDQLTAEQNASNAAYDEVKGDTGAYINATVDKGFWETLGGLFTGDTWKDLAKELNLEKKYHDVKIFSKNGTCFIFKSDENNTGFLIALTEEKASITEMDAKEYAAYSTSFDAIAAAQAAQKAADAAQKEAQALQAYYEAQEAVKAAREKVEALELLVKENAAKRAELAEAKKALEEAEANQKEAKDAADEAKKIYEDLNKKQQDAQKTVKTLPAEVEFYVLNAGLGIPAEPYSYPSSNYSKAVKGTITSEAADKIKQSKATWVVDPASVMSYIVSAPSASDFGLEGDIYWYVIKRESNGKLHVDGILKNQQFDLTIHYGYKDGDEFVEWENLKVEEKVMLNATYSYTSPEVEFYAAKKTIVSGTMKGNVEEWVEYTQKDVTPIEIRYFRGSVDDTPEYVDDTFKVETEDIESAENQAAYVAAIAANTADDSVLNQYRTEGYYDGRVVAYAINEEGTFVIDILYEAVVVPATPSEPTPGDDGPDDTDDTTEVVTVVTPAATPAPTNTVTTVNAPATPVTVEDLATTIVEEQTPLAPAINDDNQNGNGGSKEQEVVTIEEEEAPLAAPGHCWIHWLILLLTVVYTVYELVRCIARNKKINELQDDAEQAEA